LDEALERVGESGLSESRHTAERHSAHIVAERVREQLTLSGSLEADRSGNIETLLDRVLAPSPRQHTTKPFASHIAASNRFASRRWSTLAGLAAATLAVVVALVHPWSAHVVPARHYQTRVAEQLTVNLPDGSRVTLAPSSRLEVPAGFGDRARHVILDGEAFFDVRSASATPFTVRSGDDVVTVLGTAFDVQRYATDNALRVAVTTGRVSVARRGGATVVSAGMTARVTDSITALSDTKSMPAYTDWARGELVFHDAPVSEVLAAIGRWSGYRFQCADSSIAIGRVSGVFKTSDPREMMMVLRGLLDVSMTFEDTVVVLSPRRESVPVPAHSRERYSPHSEIGR